MRLFYKIALTILTGSITMTNVLANEIPFKIRSVFDIKYAFCTIKTNDVVGSDNRTSSMQGRGMGSSSTNSLLMLENGENDVTLEIGALAWFSQEDIDNKTRATFNPEASCKLDVIKFENQKETILTSINISIDKEGIPQSLITNENEDDKKYLNYNKIQAEQSEIGHIRAKSYKTYRFPKGMEIFQFTRKIEVHGLPTWAWVNATPFTGSEEQIQKLQMAYSEFADAINDQDRSKIKKLYKISLDVWSRSMGDSEDDILESQFTKDEIENGKAKIGKINWEDYAVRVMNKGRMVQFYNKSIPTYSPLTYFYNEDGETYSMSFAPIFSLIDGKFVVVI